jgi:hypothetical protein
VFPLPRTKHKTHNTTTLEKVNETHVRIHTIQRIRTGWAKCIFIQLIMKHKTQNMPIYEIGVRIHII